MNFLISFCLNNRITVILLTIALAIISIFVVKNIPVDVFPELKVPRVTIQTEAPGLTAEEVEQYITIPIESAMNGTAGVKGVRSSSGSGLSTVTGLRVVSSTGTSMRMPSGIGSQRGTQNVCFAQWSACRPMRARLPP